MIDIIISVYYKPKNRQNPQQMQVHNPVTKKDENRLQKDCGEEVLIFNNYKKRKETLITILSKPSNMRHGRIDCILASQHHKKLTADSTRLLRSTPTKRDLNSSSFANGNRQDAQTRLHWTCNKRVDDAGSTFPYKQWITSLLCRLSRVQTGNCPRQIPATS